MAERRIEHVDDICDPLAGQLAAVAAALDEVEPTTAWRCSDARVADVVAVVERLSRRLAAIQLGAIAEGVRRGLPYDAGAGTGLSAPGRWVRSLISVTPGDAARRAELATTLFTGPSSTELAPTRDALLAGLMGTAHAAHVVEAVHRLLPPHTAEGTVDDETRSEAQALLVAAATGDAQHTAVDPTQLARAGVALTAVLDPDHGDRLARDEDRQHELRTLTLTPMPTGMFHLAGQLTAPAGHALCSALQSLSAPRPAADGSPDPRTAAMRLHDGLEQAVHLLQRVDHQLPGAHGSPNRLVVSVDARTLATRLGLHRGSRSGGPDPAPDLARGSAPTAMAELPGRWPLSPLSAQVLACDADLVAVLIGPDGHPLDVADTVYPFTVKQRAAVIERDRHCTFATCTAPPPWCQVHHLRPWSQDGPTTVTNAALLCGVHHRHVHARGLVGTVTGAGPAGAAGAASALVQVVWQAPTGQQSTHHPPAAVERAIGALAHRWHRRQARHQEAHDGTG